MSMPSDGEESSWSRGLSRRWLFNPRHPGVSTWSAGLSAEAPTPTTSHQSGTQRAEISISKKRGIYSLHTSPCRERVVEECCGLVVTVITGERPSSRYPFHPTDPRHVSSLCLSPRRSLLILIRKSKVTKWFSRVSISDPALQIRGAGPPGKRPR